MCHFYANPLSVLINAAEDEKSMGELLQSEHFEAVRSLPSYRKMVEGLLKEGKLIRARALLEDDKTLFEEIVTSLRDKDNVLTKLLQATHVLLSITTGLLETTDVCMKAFPDLSTTSEPVQNVLDSIKRMTPHELLALLDRISGAVESGSPDFDLDGWFKGDLGVLAEVLEIKTQISLLQEESSRTGNAIRSKYMMSSKGIRTTVVAQRIQLSKAKSTLSKQDDKFTALVDCLSGVLEEYFSLQSPTKMFLSEVWLYDAKSPYRDVFTPRPKFAVERALSMPHDYLGCQCCKATEEGLSSTQPATAILYQLYLETGSLINVFDLWSAFLAIVGGEEGSGCDERDALALFYRALADLKMLGMVKPSRKKADHVAKLTWKGL